MLMSVPILLGVITNGLSFLYLQPTTRNVCSLPCPSALLPESRVHHLCWPPVFSTSFGILMFSRLDIFQDGLSQFSAMWQM